MASFKRVLMFDPSLIHRFGHFYIQTKSLVEALSRQGYEHLTLLCDRAGDLVAELGAQAILNYPAWNNKRLEAFTYAGNWVNANIASEEGLKRATALGLRSDDLFLMHSVSPNELISISNWYSSLQSVKPFLFVCVHAPAKYYAADNDKDIATALFKRSLSDWRGLVQGGRVRLASTNSEFSEQMSDLGGLPVVCAPLIVPVAGIRQHSVSSLSDELTFSFTGFTHEKGLAKLVNVLRDVEFQNLRFKLQIGHQQANDMARTMLQHRPYVQVVSGFSAAESYERFIGTSDAVLLPYDPVEYDMRHSSIFMESLGAGKPVLITQGTCMARELVDWGLPGVLMRGYSEQSLIEGINRLQNEFNIRKHIAERIASAYSTQLTSSAYLERLEGWFGSDESRPN